MSNHGVARVSHQLLWCLISVTMVFSPVAMVSPSVAMVLSLVAKVNRMVIDGCQGVPEVLWCSKAFPEVLGCSLSCDEVSWEFP